jgi:hypothetical protein
VGLSGSQRPTALAPKPHHYPNEDTRPVPCPMARLRRLLVALAVAALLLVATAGLALAGLTATAAD